MTAARAMSPVERIAGQAGATLPRVSEEAIHRSVADYLARCARPGVFWTHVPNGGMRPYAEAAKLKGMGAKAGVPDLMIVKEGRAMWLELKTESGRLSPAQAALHAELRAAGCEVWVAYGLDDALQWLKAMGAVR